MSGAPTPTREAPQGVSQARSRVARERDAADRDGVAASLTPTAWQRLKSRRLWIMIAIIALIGGGVTMMLQGMSTSSNASPLDPQSAKPNGAKAIVQAMADRGVDVQHTESLDGVREAVGDDPTGATVVLQQRSVALTSAQLGELRALGVANIVLIAPGPPTLSGIGSAILPGGTVGGDDSQTVAVGDTCDDPIATNAPEITNLGGGVYTVPDEPGLSGCYPSEDKHAVAIDASGETTITAIGATQNLANERVASDGNAALGIGLLGDSERLVWYVPGNDDLAAQGGPPPLETFVPPWLTPAMILIVAVGIATIVWRGRRYGPLVTERLPVTVRASETMDGRARLYGRTGSRLRALDNLRIGTIGRLAKAMALPPSSPAHEVAIAAAQTTRWPRDEVISMLIEAVPANDGELVELSDHLLRLERACHEALAIPTDQTTASRTDDTAPPRGDA